MKYLIVIALGLLATLPFFSLASTYQYVDMSGNIQKVDANDPNQALVETSVQTNDDPHSGVIIDQALPDSIDTVANIYQYTTISGQTKTVQAATLDSAIMLAPDRNPASGFTVVNVVIK